MPKARFRAVQRFSSEKHLPDAGQISVSGDRVIVILNSFAP